MRKRPPAILTLAAIMVLAACSPSPPELNSDVDGTASISTPQVNQIRDAAPSRVITTVTDPDDAQLANGLIYTTVREGTGETPKEADTVTVRYEGRFVDGRVFDSSTQNNGPSTFPLNAVIPCWTEGLQHMKAGGKAQLVCPPGLAFGEDGHPPEIPGNAILIFDVELLDVVTAKSEAGAVKPDTKVTLDDFRKWDQVMEGIDRDLDEMDREDEQRAKRKPAGQ